MLSTEQLGGFLTAPTTLVSGKSAGSQRFVYPRLVYLGGGAGFLQTKPWSFNAGFSAFFGPVWALTVNANYMNKAGIWGGGPFLPGTLQFNVILLFKVFINCGRGNPGVLDTHRNPSVSLPILSAAHPSAYPSCKHLSGVVWFNSMIH